MKRPILWILPFVFSAPLCALNCEEAFLAAYRSQMQGDLEDWGDMQSRIEGVETLSDSQRRAKLASVHSNAVADLEEFHELDNRLERALAEHDEKLLRLQKHFSKESGDGRGLKALRKAVENFLDAYARIQSRDDWPGLEKLSQKIAKRQVGLEYQTDLAQESRDLMKARQELVEAHAAAREISLQRAEWKKREIYKLREMHVPPEEDTLSPLRLAFAQSAASHSPRTGERALAYAQRLLQTSDTLKKGGGELGFFQIIEESDSTLNDLILAELKAQDPLFFEQLRNDHLEEAVVTLRERVRSLEGRSKGISILGAAFLFFVMHGCWDNDSSRIRRVDNEVDTVRRELKKEISELEQRLRALQRD
jgi:hypothetical protein